MEVFVTSAAAAGCFSAAAGCWFVYVAAAVAADQQPGLTCPIQFYSVRKE